jgi:hypothetical protein
MYFNFVAVFIILERWSSEQQAHLNRTFGLSDYRTVGLTGFRIKATPPVSRGRPMTINKVLVYIFVYSSSMYS